MVPFAANGNVPKIMERVSQKKIITGYQINESALGHPDCIETKTACDEQMFKSVLGNVVNAGASFVEIFADDVPAYPRHSSDQSRGFLRENEKPRCDS